MSENELITLIKNGTQCIICNNIQIVPNFVTISGGNIVHYSCANAWLKTNPTKNLYNNPLKHNTFDLNILSNNLYKYGLKYTTIFDEDIKKITEDDLLFSSSSDIIKLIIEIPKLGDLIPQHLFRICLWNCLNDSTIIGKLAQFFDIMGVGNEEEIYKIPIDILFNYREIANLFDSELVKKHINNSFEDTLFTYNDDLICSIYNSDFCPHNVRSYFIIACETCPNFAIRLLQDYTFNEMDLYSTDYIDNTAFILACKYNYNNLLNHLLLKFGSNMEIINYINKNNESALTVAFTKNHVECVKTLITNSFSLDINHINLYGDTLFSWAIITNNLDIISLVIQNYYNNNTSIALSKVFQYVRNIPKTIHNFLLNYPNAKFSLTFYNNVVSWTVYNKYIEILLILIKHQLFDPNFPYCNNFLENTDIHPNQFPITLLQYAIITNDNVVFDKLLSNKKLNPNLTYNYLPSLIIACEYNKINMFSLLISDTRIDPNITNENGNTALMYFIKQNNNNMILLLLRHKLINPYIKNINQETASQIAVKNNCTSIFEHSLKWDFENRQLFIQAHSELALTSILDHKSYQLFDKLINNYNFNPKKIGYPYNIPVSINTFNFTNINNLNKNDHKIIYRLLFSPYIIVELGIAIHCIKKWAKQFNYSVLDMINKRLSPYYGTKQKKEHCNYFNNCRKKKCLLTHSLCSHSLPVSLPCCEKYHSLIFNGYVNK
jgi:ankyrin repeat protein